MSNCKNRDCLIFENERIYNKTAQTTWLYTTPDEHHNFSLGESLQNNPYIFESVLNYLGVEDLENVGLVNNFWRWEAEKILEKRSELGWISVYEHGERFYNFKISTSQNYGFVKPLFGIIFTRDITSPKGQCCYHSENGTTSLISFVDFFKKHLFGASHCFIIGVDIDCLYSDFKIDQGYLHSSLFNCCLIPHIPNIELAVFVGDLDNCKHHLHGSNLENTKCLIIFASSKCRYTNYLKKFKEFIRYSRFEIPYAATYCERKICCSMGDCNVSTTDNIIFAFAEKDSTEISNFEAHSRIVCNLQEFEGVVTKLKDRALLRQNSLIFLMLASKELKTHCHGILENKFPRTILLTFCGGHKPVGLNSHSGNNSYKEPVPVIIALVFLTWGKIVKVCK